MEENSKDQGKLSRVMMKLLKAENKLSFYGIVMQYLKFQQLYLVAIQPKHMNTLMVKSKSLNRQGR